MLNLTQKVQNQSLSRRTDVIRVFALLEIEAIILIGAGYVIMLIRDWVRDNDSFYRGFSSGYKFRDYDIARVWYRNN